MYEDKKHKQLHCPINNIYWFKNIKCPTSENTKYKESLMFKAFILWKNNN